MEYVRAIKMDFALCTIMLTCFSNVFRDVKCVIGGYIFSCFVGFMFFQVTKLDVVDVIESVLKDTRLSLDIVAFLSTTLLKLSSYFFHCFE
jgi:hypothetical protein